MKTGNRSLRIFLILVISLSAAVEAGICLGGSQWLYLLLMWIPAFGAIAANLAGMKEGGEKFSLGRLSAANGFHRCPLRYVLLGCLLPLLYLLIPYLVYWRLYPDSFAYRGVKPGTIGKDLLPVMILGIFPSLLSAIGEEIGWRGFLVPALYRKFGLNPALILSSLFWCCWHLPLLIGGGYMSGTPLWFQLPAFLLCIFPVGIMAGLLSLESGSVWPAAFLHAAHNNYDQAVFGLITRGTNRMFFVSETGVLTILCAWALAGVMYLRWKTKQPAGERPVIKDKGE